jgi:hypothetical protein
MIIKDGINSKVKPKIGSNRPFGRLMLDFVPNQDWIIHGWEDHPEYYKENNPNNCRQEPLFVIVPVVAASACFVLINFACAFVL